MAGVSYHHAPGAKALLECAKDTIDLERGFRINRATAFTFAAFMGTPELCEIIIKAGASRTHIQDHGSTKLRDACCNVATTKLMLGMIWNDGELDINCVIRPRTFFWRLIDSYFQMGVRCGLMSKSQFEMEMAHSEGSTALHCSAMIGLIDVAEWLLGHGAHKSLHIRNTMGATPLDIARIFGPYPAIEAMLGAAMLNRQFDTQFAIRRGSLLRKQAGGAIDPEVDDDSPSDENRAPEPTLVETIADSKSVSSGNEGNAVVAVDSTEPPTPVETIADSSESASSGFDGTAEGAVVDTHTACLAANQTASYGPLGKRVDSPVNVGAALAMLSSDVEARFDKQTARFDEQTARFDEQAARLDALQSENAAIIAKLNVLLVAQQQR